jgi:hypothetical protein
MFGSLLLAIIPLFNFFWHHRNISINSASNGVCDFITVSTYNGGGKFNKLES